jgi:hypothetical protein
MRTQLYYPPDNLQTAKYLEERLGRRSEFARSESKREGGGETQGLSEQAVPVLTAWQIQHELNDDQIIGFHGRRPPFQGRRLMPGHFPLLEKRRCLRPPALHPLPPLTPIARHHLQTPSADGADDDPINPGDFE